MKHSELERYRYDGHGRRVQAFHDARDNLYSIYGQDGVLRYQADYRTRQTRRYVYLAAAWWPRAGTRPRCRRRRR